MPGDMEDKMRIRKADVIVRDWIQLPTVEAPTPSIEPDRIGGVYLRLLARSPNSDHDLFQVNAVINGIEYEIEMTARAPAFQLARAIADLAITDTFYTPNQDTFI